MKEIRVSIIEDEDLIREMLAAGIESKEGLSCRNLYSCAEDGLAAITPGNTDVILMDIGLPKMSGIEATRIIKNKFPGIQIIILTVFEDSEKIFKALKAGATGYLLKKSSSDKIHESIHDVMTGGSPMSGEIARKVVQSFNIKENTSDELKLLTAREMDLLNFLSRGYRYKDIADQMFISTNTVRTHIRHIYEKLHVQSGIEAINKLKGL